MREAWTPDHLRATYGGRLTLLEDAGRAMGEAGRGGTRT
jgi:hypothetical protein